MRRTLKLIYCFFLGSILHLVIFSHQAFSNNDLSEKSDRRRQANFFSGLFDNPFFAAEKPIHFLFDMSQMVTTPTRSGEKVGALASDVTVVQGKELDQKGIYTVKEALRRQRGIDVAQSGGFGGQTSLFMRGANAGHTRVMIDGVRIYDPTATNGAFDLAHLTLDNVDQIEIVRGPQSSLYGSDAMGGVVNIITKRGEGKPQFKAYVEGGSFQSDREGVNFSGQADELHFAFAGSHFSTDGISLASERLNNPEKDAYQKAAFSGRLDYEMSDLLTLGAITRYTYVDMSLDDGGGANRDDVNRTGWSEQAVESFYVEHKPFQRIQQKVQVSLMQNHRRGYDEGDANQSEDYLRDKFYGDSFEVYWQSGFEIFDFDKVIIGIDHLRDKAQTYSYGTYSGGSYESIFPARRSFNTGYFLENRFNLNDRLTATANYRIENHSKFGNHDTYRLDGLYRLSRLNTAIKAAYGTGFKAPTLYQLYAPADPYFGGGNGALRPEKSRTYECGIEQPLFERMDASLIYFHNDFTDLIDAVYHSDTWITDQYKNVGRAQSFGYESQIKYRVNAALVLTAHYTWMDTEDKDTHKKLLKRAKNKGVLDIEYNPCNEFHSGIEIFYTGNRLDVDDAILKRYTRIDLYAVYDLNDQVAIYGRIENLLDRTYEEVKGYGTPGFSVYGGLRLSF